MLYKSISKIRKRKYLRKRNLPRSLVVIFTVPIADRGCARTATWTDIKPKTVRFMRASEDFDTYAPAQQ